MEPLFFLGLWMVLGAAAGHLAKTKDRSGCLWFFLVFLFPPLILLILVLPARGDKSGIITVRTSSGMPLRIQERVKCPRCAEVVKSEAKTCRFCRYDLETWKNELAARQDRDRPFTSPSRPESR